MDTLGILLINVCYTTLVILTCVIFVKSWFFALFLMFNFVVSIYFVYGVVKRHVLLQMVNEGILGYLENIDVGKMYCWLKDVGFF